MSRVFVPKPENESVNCWVVRDDKSVVMYARGDTTVTPRPSRLMESDLVRMARDGLATELDPEPEGPKNYFDPDYKPGERKS